MGGASSKEEERPVSGVQVTEGLIRQLSGETKARPTVRPSKTVGPSWMPHLRPAFTPQTDEHKGQASHQEQPEEQHEANPQQEQPEELHEAAPAAFATPHPPEYKPAAIQHIQEQIQQAAPEAELKAEAVSQQKVNEFADQLVGEYEAPLKALPCLDEKTSCLLCYQQHQEDPLRCAQQVAAFTKCAQKASAITVQ